MDKQDTRRINPIAHFTLAAVVVLVVLEVLVILGAFELKAKTVAKYAPWAYESFLRIVGEHPESTPRWAPVVESEKDEAVDAKVAGAAGLEPAAIPILIETNETILATNLILEATVPLEVESGPTPVDEPINTPADEPQEIVPVG